MSDVFISYSRLDKDFVGQLREALLNQNQEIWIDWESIPPSQAWWDEIKKGIAKANNFVVVLSPHSMASPICQMEIEYARQLKKRIIPVLHKDFVREDALVEITKRLAKKEETTTRELWGSRQPHDIFDANDGELKHTNYFLFGPEDNFLTRFAELFTIIRTDYAHKELHTTLDLRVREWERRGRDASFLLLDTELAQAEDWLTQAKDKEPVPTDLQCEYIQASERRTRQLRNIRRTSIIGSIVAVIALVFAIGATLVGIRANDSANQAGTLIAIVNIQVTKANGALTAVPPTLTQVAEQVTAGEALIEALRLAALAVDELQDGNAITASLLGIRSVNTVYTSQADTALFAALRENLALMVLTGHTEDIASATYSPDGRFIATASGDHTAIIWDAANGEALHTLQGHTSVVWNAAYSPDGRFIVTASADGTAIVWDTTSGESLRTLQGHNATYSPDGRFIVTANYDGTVIIWDATNGEALRTLKGHTEGIASATYSPDGRFIVTANYDGTAIIWDATTGEALHILMLLANPPSGS